MKVQMFILVLTAVCAGALTACSSSGVVQLSTAAQGTPAPSGQIDVPGLKIQLYVPGQNPMINTADAHGGPAGFWRGVWHGVISPFTLAASFIGRAHVQMYEVHNDGRLYNLGFFLGILVMPAVLGVFFGVRH